MTGESNRNAADRKVLVVYDGHCGFCRKQVESIRRRDRRGAFDYISRLDPELPRRYPGRADMLTPGSMKALLPDGRLAEGADAVYEIARRLSWYRWVVWVYLLPGFRQLGRGVYGWIARNRYRFGGDLSCDVPPRAVGDGAERDSR